MTPVIGMLCANYKNSCLALNLILHIWRIHFMEETLISLLVALVAALFIVLSFEFYLGL